LIKLRMIVLKNKEDAQGVLNALEGGASFVKLAREISVGPNAGRGGHIGTVDINRLKPELREALGGLKPGEHTGAVETALGYTIFQVTTDEYYEKGLGLFDKGRYKGAIQEFRQDLKLNPDSAFSYFYLGLSQNKLNLNEEAAASLEKAASLEPKLTETYYNLGRVYTALGRSDDAEKAYRKTIEIAPDFHMAHNNLALLLIKDRKKVDDAMEHAKRAIELAPSNAAYYHTLATIYKGAGNLKEAVKSLQMASRLAPDDAFYKEQLALLEGPHPVKKKPPAAPREEASAAPVKVAKQTQPPSKPASQEPPARQSPKKLPARPIAKKLPVKPAAQAPPISPTPPKSAVEPSSPPPLPRGRVARIAPSEQEQRGKPYEGLRIKILNGNGIQGAAAQFVKTLEAMNYKVEETDNADSFDWARTTIYYREDKKKEAIELAHKIPGEQDVVKLKDHQLFDIVIVLGIE